MKINYIGRPLFPKDRLSPEGLIPMCLIEILGA